MRTIAARSDKRVNHAVLEVKVEKGKISVPASEIVIASKTYSLPEVEHTFEAPKKDMELMGWVVLKDGKPMWAVDEMVTEKDMPLHLTMDEHGMVHLFCAFHLSVKAGAQIADGILYQIIPNE